MSPLDISSQSVQINEEWKATAADSTAHYGREYCVSLAYCWPETTSSTATCSKPLGRAELTPVVLALCHRSYIGMAIFVVSVWLWHKAPLT